MSKSRKRRVGRSRGREFIDPVSGKKRKGKYFKLEVHETKKVVSVEIQGRRAKWPQWYIFEDFKRANPNISFKDEWAYAS